MMGLWAHYPCWDEKHSSFIFVDIVSISLRFLLKKEFSCKKKKSLIIDAIFWFSLVIIVYALQIGLVVLQTKQPEYTYRLPLNILNSLWYQNKNHFFIKSYLSIIVKLEEIQIKSIEKKFKIITLLSSDET